MKAKNKIDPTLLAFSPVLKDSFNQFLPIPEPDWMFAFFEKTAVRIDNDYELYGDFQRAGGHIRFVLTDQTYAVALQTVQGRVVCIRDDEKEKSGLSLHMPALVLHMYLSRQLHLQKALMQKFIVVNGGIRALLSLAPLVEQIRPAYAELYRNEISGGANA
jgi:hypothetical protein